MCQVKEGDSSASAWQEGSHWTQYNPRLLRLRPEDVGKMHGAPLHRARFAAPSGPDEAQDWVTASIANYTLLFSFR